MHVPMNGFSNFFLAETRPEDGRTNVRNVWPIADSLQQSVLARRTFIG
jgi:hypothetical protein